MLSWFFRDPSWEDNGSSISLRMVDDFTIYFVRRKRNSFGMVKKY